MDAGDKSGSETTTNCIVSPLGKSRYGRTRKPKISEDFCNIDDVFNEAKSPPKSGKNSPKKLRSSPVVRLEKLFLPKRIEPLPKTAGSVKQSEPTKPVVTKASSAVKERKFFKKLPENNSSTVQNNSESGVEDSESVQNSEDVLSTIDLTKVLKIIKSKTAELSPSPETFKPSTKSVLRTYSNKRKSLPKPDVIESFGLPDNPIIPLNSPKTNVPIKLNKKLDLVESPNNDVNIVDVSLLEKPWEISKIDLTEDDKNDCTIENLSDEFGVFDEIRIKADESIVKNTSIRATEEKHSNENPADKTRENDTINGEDSIQNDSVESTVSSKDEIENISDKNFSLLETDNLNKNSEIICVTSSNDLVMKKQEMNKIISPQKLLVNKTETPAASPKKPLIKITHMQIVSPKKSVINKTEMQIVSPKKPLINKTEIPTGSPRKSLIKKTEMQIVSPKKPLINKSETPTVSPKKSLINKTDVQIVSSKKPLIHKTEIKIVSPKKSITNKTETVSQKKTVIKKTDTHIVSPKKPAETSSRGLRSRTSFGADNSKTIQKESKSNEAVSSSDSTKKVHKKLSSTPSKDDKAKRSEDTKHSPKQLRSSVIVIEKLPEVIDLTQKKENKDVKEKKADAKKEKAKEELLRPSDIKQETTDYEVGDLMWAQIGSHPYWPCVIVREPETNAKSKTIYRGTKTIKMYHVKFFADKGRRSWVSGYHIMPFVSEKDLDILLDKAKKEDKDTSVYTVKQNKLDKWKQAVEEACSLKTKSVQERLDFFVHMFGSMAEKREKLLLPPPDTKLKRKIKVEDEDDVTTKQFKKLKVNKFSLELRSRISDVKKNSNEPKPKKETPPKIQLSERAIRNLKHDLQYSEQESDTDSSSKISVNSTSMQSQAALYRRNNIFKGITREKVCQICEKHDNVLKCKGPCNIFLHEGCKEKLQKPESKEETAEESIKEIVPPENKEEEEKKEDSLPVSNTSPQTKVIHQCVYKNLAEQIDAKMKEIMRKFEIKTTYTDSSSDYTSSEESSADKKNATENPTPSENSNKKIQHVTADHVTFANSDDSKDTESTNDKKHEASEESQNKEFKCHMCENKIDPPCFVCGENVSRKGSSVRQKCSLHQCGRFYHTECLKTWLQTQWSFGANPKQKTEDSFMCPQHVCHTCVSDNPRAALSRVGSDKLVRCLRCPATYHSSSYCVPAGTAILSSTQVVCPRHMGEHNPRTGKQEKVPKTINTNWCFICSEGGDLFCCETCPTSIHPDCMKINLTDDDKFICEDCESGRFPLYDEIVWVKLGSYRWWPAVTLFPNDVPDNVNNLPHNEGEFVVKFFGTQDHYWVSRGRCFLFQEGDQGHTVSGKNKMGMVFQKAVDEAIAAHQLKQDFKNTREAQRNNTLKPPPYVKIKSNRPVGNVRQVDANNTSNTTACDCDPTKPHPCGPDSDCLNRLLLTECNPEVCPAGKRCNNQRFEKREYPPLVPYKTQGRGWGLKALAPIGKGQFVIEYVGEMIDEHEYKRRVQRMHEQKEENYYFLTIDKDRMLDAGPKGNVARFMNHSCQPNCETQKWTVNGDTRVGLFAIDDIPANTELTFNYNLECIGEEKKICRCEAPNCSGFIGVKVKSEESIKKSKKKLKKLKKKPTESKEKNIISNSDNVCFVCGKSGEVGACNNKVCPKYYHLECVNLRRWPSNGKWECPWHSCNICYESTIRCCEKCTNSYCVNHSEGNIRHDNLLGYTCSEHDPFKEKYEIQPQDTSYKNVVPTETGEADVTSTISDDPDTDVISIDCNKSVCGDSADKQNEADFKDVVSSTPLKKRESVLELAGSSTEKKKRGRPRKVPYLRGKSAVKQPVQPKLPEKTATEVIVSVHNEVKLTSSVPTRHLRTSKSSSENSLTEFEKFLKRQMQMEKDLPIRKRSRLRCETDL